MLTVASTSANYVNGYQFHAVYANSSGSTITNAATLIKGTPTPNVTYTYNADGQMTAMTDGTGSSTYTYDSLGRMTATTDGANDATSYGYDLGGDVTSITYPNNQTVAKTYDYDNRLQTVSDWLGNTTNFAYDPDSNLATTTFPAATGDVDSYAYDDTDSMSGVTYKQGSTTLGSLAYGRDNNSQVTQTTPTALPGAAANSSYNQLNQLNAVGSSNYAYDGAGDPTQLAGSPALSYDNAGELTSGPQGTYSYDALGERTQLTPSSGTATTYQYNQAGELTGASTPVTSASYGYNGAGLLTSRTASGATASYVWDSTSGLPVVLRDSTNSYIYGPADLPIEQINSSGTPTYYHHDQLGSTRMLTNQAGQPVATFTYDAYGNPVGATGSVTTPLGYAGQYTDPNTGLIYMRARWYDPTTGQFVSVDPLVQLTGERYSYANDSPLTYYDPTGEGSILGTIGHLLFPSGGSTQICVGGTVSVPDVVTVSLDGCFVQTSDGDGVIATGSVGRGPGIGFNVHGGIGESNACRPSDYGGFFSQGGGSAEYFGGGYYNRFTSYPFSAGGRTVQGWTVGGSAGFGAEAGGGASYTLAVPIGGQSGGSSSSGCGC